MNVKTVNVVMASRTKGRPATTLENLVPKAYDRTMGLLWKGGRRQVHQRAPDLASQTCSALGQYLALRATFHRILRRLLPKMMFWYSGCISPANCAKLGTSG
jgi:hypothetical protein